MEFSIEFYESVSGHCPVRVFLESLKVTDPDDFASVMAGIAKLRDRDYHRLPLSKPLGKDLFELRHVGKLNSRIFYFFAGGRKIVLVHGLRNKGQGVPKKDIVVAERRKKEWESSRRYETKNQF
jgi:phage-related protein